jgi:hypothetical protein
VRLTGRHGPKNVRRLFWFLGWVMEFPADLDRQF